MERIVSPIERAGERLEEASKGLNPETLQETDEKKEVTEAPEKPEVQAPQKEGQPPEGIVVRKESSISQNMEIETEKSDEGFVEVNVKIKTPHKKRKRNNYPSNLAPYSLREKKV